MAGKVIRSIKNVANGYSTVQIMVRDATCNDPSGPSTSQMADVANHTYDNGEFLEVMDMIDRRLNDKGKNWRHVAKSLTLLDYLVRYGSDDVVLWARQNLYIIKTLREFQAEDATGRDQGQIIRVKAKELTSLLKDDERLRQEREVARQRLADRRRNKRNGRPEPAEYDDDLQKALEESRLTAEEENRRRMNKSDDSLDKAIQLSLEEEELRKKNQNLLDLDEIPQSQPPQVFGFYDQQQQQPQQNQGQIIGYDVYGNPVYGNQPMATGYLQNAYQDLAAQQQQQQLYEQQLQAQQQAAQQQAAMQQQYYLQQQQLYQQQLAAAQQQAALQQQQLSTKTGSNNPFALGTQQPQQLQQPQPDTSIQQQQKQHKEQRPMAATSTTQQIMNDRYAELNQLLATGTGIDTFGNTGETRIPAQHTKTGTFINSQGTGFRQETGNNNANPFLGTQYTGIPATGIVPAYTGYGFGNQQPAGTPAGGSRANGNSLIDL